MYVLFIVVNQREYVPEVLAKMSQLGIRGATVLDSMGAYSLNKQVYSMPLIGSFLKGLDGDMKYNNTIFSVIEREDQVHRVIEHIERLLGGDMAKPNKGIMFAMPVTHFRGGELQRHIESRENKKVMKKEFESEYY